MKKIENELKEIFKTINGNLLLIGNYSDKIINKIEQNKNILVCDQLSNSNNTNKNGNKGKSKKINIKKIKKHYKRKNINNSVIDFEHVLPYKNTFIKDSSYITKNKIIIIAKEDNDLIYKMYSRYTKNINKVDCLDGKIYVIETSKIKKNPIMNIIYLIQDTFIDIITIVSDLI